METGDGKRRIRTGAFGPGLLITAAFIGPGTVTTASVTGAAYGYALLWAVLFSILATTVLQEMASRLGVVTRFGLGEAIRTSTPHTILRTLIAMAVVASITFGNAAFETGNITGAALGLQSAFGLRSEVGALLIGAMAFVLLIFGSYKRIERVLVAIVVLMSAAFVVTALMSKPSLAGIARGAFVPAIPPGSGVTVLALIGTTVVPYNLFLHASIVSEKWPANEPIGDTIRRARWDTVLSVALGGLVTAAIVASAAACFPIGTSIDSASAMAEQLRPLLGHWADRVFAAGLLAAGLTSAITAPLAAAYATCGVLGWPAQTASLRFRIVWAAILVIGTALAVTGGSPIAAIVFAQAANAIVLPIIAILLLVVLNRRSVMGDHANRLLSNVAGVCVIGVVIVLAGTKLARMLRFLL